ncbi:extracellular matrix regulator RemB [Bacillota bacterium Lsc_1132]
MYIHIGEDLNIQAQDVIAILDKKSVNSSSFVEEFLKRHHESIINLSKKSFKSIVITSNKVYLSPLASGTLKKRTSLPATQGFSQ